MASTTRELIDQKYLSQFRVSAPAHPDLTGGRTVRGDFHEGDLAKAMGKPELVADVVETWLRLGEDRPTLVFAVDRADAKKRAERFEAAGVLVAYQDAYTDSDDPMATLLQVSATTSASPRARGVALHARIHG